MYLLFQIFFQNKYGNRLIRLITKIGFRLLTDNRFQIFSDYTTLDSTGPTKFSLAHIQNVKNAQIL